MKFAGGTKLCGAIHIEEDWNSIQDKLDDLGR